MVSHEKEDYGLLSIHTNYYTTIRKELLKNTKATLIISLICVYCSRKRQNLYLYALNYIVSHLSNSKVLSNNWK